VMFVPHGRRHTEHVSIVERADNSLALVPDLRTGELFWKAPNLATAGDRGVVVEVQGVCVTAFLNDTVGSAEADRDHLTSFRVVPEPSRVRHTDEFVIDGVADDLQRFRNDCA